MANSRSAEKRVRQQQKRRQHNRAHRSRMKTAIKRVLAAPDAESARAEFRNAAALLDRLASRHLIHRNKAARTKSRLARRINALS